MGWIKEKTSAVTLRMAMRKKGKRSRLTMNNFLLRLCLFVVVMTKKFKKLISYVFYVKRLIVISV